MNVDDAVHLIGCGTTTLYKLINTGRLKSTTVGRKRLISVQSIEDLGQTGSTGMGPIA